MLKVVSNTTPIITLLKIGKLEILKSIYKEINIPLEVFNEIEAGKSKIYYQDLSKLDWVVIHEIKNDKATNYFLDLDKGEAESIILASEMDADLIIIDETLGRFHAKHTGIKITGTIGVLLKAKQLGFIKYLKPIFSELKSKDIWLSNKLIDKVLKIANE